jgi:hypothetical protein
VLYSITGNPSTGGIVCCARDLYHLFFGQATMLNKKKDVMSCFKILATRDFDLCRQDLEKLHLLSDITNNFAAVYLP